MKFIKLLLGATFFIVLCGSAMMLLVLFLGFSDGHVNTRSLSSLLASILVFLASSIALYYLSRETPETEPSDVSKQFKTQKLKLQLSAIALITFIILVLRFVASISHYALLEAFIISAVFIELYIQLARKFWRCPACGAQLPFMNDLKDRQSIKSCPNCSTQLQ